MKTDNAIREILEKKGITLTAGEIYYIQAALKFDIDEAVQETTRKFIEDCMKSKQK